MIETVRQVAVKGGLTGVSIKQSGGHLFQCSEAHKNQSIPAA
jgi:hypothetical protein